MKPSGLGRWPDLLALGLAVATCGVGLYGSTRVAGGSDSYGYVSQALLWSSGDVAPQEPAIPDAPWKDAAATLAPLGYRVSADGTGVVPQYPPGLPLLFAVAHRLGGMPALYAVVPLLGGLAVGLTYALARRSLAGGWALLPALLLATTSAFLHQSFQPMSDVPVTAAWLAAIACGSRARSKGWWCLATGAASSIALLIRPNLAPLAIVLALWSAVLFRRIQSLTLLLGGALPGLALLATINSAWYGSPLRFGYGPGDALFGLRHVLPNLTHYAGWWTEQQTAFLALGFAAPFLAVRGRSADARSWRVFGASFAFVVVALYLPYLEFSDWTYLRFFLPAVPLLAILAVETAQQLLEHRRGGRALAVATVGVVAVFGAWRAVDNGSFRLAVEESRYPAVAAAVQRCCEPNAVFITVQHSGSLRLYAERTTVRWDVMPPRAMARAIGWLEESGRPVYFLLEDWELDEIRERFPGALDSSSASEPLDSWSGASLYRPAALFSPTPSRRRPTSRPRSAARRPTRPD